MCFINQLPAGRLCDTNVPVIPKLVPACISIDPACNPRKYNDPEIEYPARKLVDETSNI